MARPEINSIDDLANQKVGVDLRESSTAITARRLFDLLKLQVTLTDDPPEVALEKLRNGEIAALAYVAGKPAPFFRDVTRDDGLHLLAVPFNPVMAAGYMPARLTASDYPNLVPQSRPVDTVGVGTVLVAANLQPAPERYRNVANFVDAFFTGFQSLLEPGHHPKWREVNLGADLTGWRRYPPAEQWLQRNQQVSNAANPQEVMAMFARFVDERRQSMDGAPNDGAGKIRPLPTVSTLANRSAAVIAAAQPLDGVFDDGSANRRRPPGCPSCAGRLSSARSLPCSSPMQRSLPSRVLAGAAY